jgi:hypothetical protein
MLQRIRQLILAHWPGEVALCAGIPGFQGRSQCARADHNDCTVGQLRAQLGDARGLIASTHNHDRQRLTLPKRLRRSKIVGKKNNVAEPSERCRKPATFSRAHIEKENSIVGRHCSPPSSSGHTACVWGPKSAPVPCGTHRRMAAPGALTCVLFQLGVTSYHGLGISSITFVCLYFFARSAVFQYHDLRSGGVWGGFASPRFFVFRLCERLRRSHRRNTEVLGGFATLQTSRLAGDRVSCINSEYQPAYPHRPNRRAIRHHRYSG